MGEKLAFTSPIIQTLAVNSTNIWFLHALFFTLRKLSTMSSQYAILWSSDCSLGAGNVHASIDGVETDTEMALQENFIRGLYYECIISGYV